MKNGKGTLPRSPQHGGGLSAGVKDGVSEVSTFESDQTVSDASFNESAGSPGFQRDVKGQRNSKSVSSKGLNFEIDGCS